MHFSRLLLIGLLGLLLSLGSAAAQTTIRITPAASEAAGAGSTFSVEVHFENYTDLYGYSVEFFYNTAAVTHTSISQGPIFNPAGGSLFLTSGSNTTTGRLLVDHAILGAVSGVSGADGLAFTVQFQGVAAGGTDWLYSTNVRARDSGNTPIPFTLVSGTGAVTIVTPDASGSVRYAALATSASYDDLGASGAAARVQNAGTTTGMVTGFRYNEEAPGGDAAPYTDPDGTVTTLAVADGAYWEVTSALAGATRNVDLGFSTVGLTGPLAPTDWRVARRAIGSGGGASWTLIPAAQTSYDAGSQQVRIDNAANDNGAGQYALVHQALPPNVAINEVDSDQDGTDDAEFVELYDGGTGNTALDGLTLVLFNGNGDVSYDAFDLDGQTTDATGFFVLCFDAANVPNCDLDAPGATTNRIQNGADAVALYVADATAFPNGTAPTAVDLLDVLVYGTDDARDTGLLAGFGITLQHNEAFSTVDPVDVSLQRLNGLPATAGVQSTESDLFYPIAPTPGLINPGSVTVDVTAEVDGTSGNPADDEAAGWRLPAFPGYEADGTPFEVDDLAAINLVQGVSGGGGFPAQYPSAGSNIYTSSAGTSSGSPTNGYVVPASTAEELTPGKGFIWYFYDLDLTLPQSDSYDLANGAFSMSADAIPPDDQINGGSVFEQTTDAVEPYDNSGTPPPNTADTRFFMIGNPGAYPFALGGIEYQAGVGETLQTSFYVWDPEIGTTPSQGGQVAGSFVPLTADTGDPFAGDALGRWDGAYAEVSFTGAAPTTGTFGFPSGFYNPVDDAEFAGRPTSSEPRISFRLDGDVTTASGDDRTVVDVAALLRFKDDAGTGWDRHDGTKPSSLSTSHALIALVGTLGDQVRRQGVFSLPTEASDPVTIPVAFTTTDAGAFTLSWDRTAAPQGWTAVWRDLVTGDEFDLADRATYAFASDASDWTNRFELTLTSSAVVSTEAPVETGLALSMPTPNPATGTTRLVLRSSAPVRVAVYDALGREIVVLHDGPLAGEQVLTVRTGRLAPGTYIVRAHGAEGSATRRFTVAR